MTSRSNFIIILLSLAISASIWIVTLHQRPFKKNREFTAKIFEGFNGWGYDILVDDELFIRQESIPSWPGKAGFQKKEQAEQTAQLIINKLKQGLVPAITTFELNQIVSINQQQYDQPGKIK
jgi:hypothetical protein